MAELEYFAAFLRCLAGRNIYFRVSAVLRMSFRAGRAGPMPRDGPPTKINISLRGAIQIA
eukprot:4132363-Pyramimonas_sp.AAC.1